MNHQGLLWNVHSIVTVALPKQLTFKSAVARNLWCLLAKSCWNINKSHLRYWLSREKIENPALVKNYSSEHIHIYSRLNRRWNDLFRIFFLRGQQKPPITKSRRTHTLQKDLFKTLTSKRYITLALKATAHRQTVNLFLNNPALSC